MTFKVKDLLIDVSSAAKAACPSHTLVACHYHCTYIISVCQFGCSIQSPSICTYNSLPTTVVTCPGSLVTDTTYIFQTIPQLEGPQIANLKDQLKQALELAERQEAAQASAQKLQTVADAELLEGKLNEALADVRAQKAELQKKK